MNPDRLREAVAWFEGTLRPPLDGTKLGVVAAAARLAFTVLEGAEKLEWCESHDSASHRPDGVPFRCDVWVAALAADGVEPYEPCRAVPSLRIPSAVFDPAKNEAQAELRELRDTPLVRGPRDGGFRACGCPTDEASK